MVVVDTNTILDGGFHGVLRMDDDGIFFKTRKEEVACHSVSVITSSRRLIVSHKARELRIVKSQLQESSSDDAYDSPRQFRCRCSRNNQGEVRSVDTRQC